MALVAGLLWLETSGSRLFVFSDLLGYIGVLISLLFGRDVDELDVSDWTGWRALFVLFIHS
jgi:hypothetical protein